MKKNGKVNGQSNQHNVVITCRHFELTEAIKKFIFNKIEKILHHDKNINYLKIILEYQPNRSHQNRYVVEGHMETKGIFMIVSECSDNMYSSINHLIEKLDREIRKHSNNVIKKRKHPHKIDLPSHLPKLQIV